MGQAEYRQIAALYERLACLDTLEDHLKNPREVQIKGVAQNNGEFKVIFTNLTTTRAAREIVRVEREFVQGEIERLTRKKPTK